LFNVALQFGNPFAFYSRFALKWKYPINKLFQLKLRFFARDVMGFLFRAVDVAHMCGVWYEFAEQK
jgi:hypothetical protein